MQCHCCMGMAMVVSIPKTFMLVCNVAVSILLAECGLMCLPDQWLLCAATLWNAHAARPPGSIQKQMALDACASSMSRAIRVTWFDLGGVTWIILTFRCCLPTSGSAGMLFGVSWTFARGPVLLGTHVCAHTRNALLGLQVAMLCHRWSGSDRTCPPCAACSACCASVWAATSCPGKFVCQD